MTTVFPNPSIVTPDVAMADLLSLLSLWISRIGGLVAFIGAIKFALSIKNEDGKEQLLAILTMVSGFMIRAALSDLSIFNIPSSYSAAQAELEFQSIMTFIGTWTGRVGAAGAFIGAIMFGLAIKDNNATNKVTGLKTMASGFIVTAVSGILWTFV